MIQCVSPSTRIDICIFRCMLRIIISIHDDMSNVVDTVFIAMREQREATNLNKISKAKTFSKTKCQRNTYMLLLIFFDDFLQVQQAKHAQGILH